MSLATKCSKKSAPSINNLANGCQDSHLGDIDYISWVVVIGIIPLPYNSHAHTTRNLSATLSAVSNVSHNPANISSLLIEGTPALCMQ